MKLLNLSLVALLIIVESVLLAQNTFVMLLQYRLNIKFNDLVYTGCKEKEEQLPWNQFLENLKIIE